AIVAFSAVTTAGGGACLDCAIAFEIWTNFVPAIAPTRMIVKPSIASMGTSSFLFGRALALPGADAGVFVASGMAVLTAAVGDRGLRLPAGRPLLRWVARGSTIRPRAPGRAWRCR